MKEFKVFSYCSYLRLTFILLIWINQPVHAYVKNTTIIRGGISLIAPFQETSDTVLNTKKNVVSPGMQVSNVSSNMQFGFNMTYMLYNDVGLDFSIATSYSQKFYVGDSLELGDIISTQPSFMIHYYPQTRDHNLKPYLAAGLRYFGFMDTDISEAFKKSAPSGYNWKMDTNSHVDLSLALGFDYWVAKNLAIQGASHYVQQNTSIQVKGIKTNSPMQMYYAYNTKIDSVVYTLGLTFKL